ncbi:hypothetical protein PP1Y_Mpl8423 (plasmid) [Novosphingobium sp. PP1Y]|nr:hypothetical protein PP1Y_Mpl8423 [Novosphingobium sp. PP1Y]
MTRRISFCVGGTRDVIVMALLISGSDAVFGSVAKILKYENGVPEMERKD